MVSLFNNWMIQEGFNSFDTLGDFFDGTVIGHFVGIKGDIRLLEKTLKSSNKDYELVMRERYLYWSDRINTFLKSKLHTKLDEDSAEIDFLFENKEEVVLIICCLEDVYPDLPLRESGVRPPFLFVREGNLEELRNHIKYECGYIKGINEAWGVHSEDEFWYSLRVAINEAVNLDECSIYFYVPKTEEMDPYTIMEDGDASSKSTCCYFYNPMRKRLVAVEYVFYRPMKLNGNEESEQSDVDEDF